MRIAMIGQKGIPAVSGGVERHVHDLAIELANLSYPVTVYSRKWYCPERFDSYQGVNIKYVPSLKTKHLDAISHSLLATFDAIRNKVDVIHYHGVGPSLVSWVPRLFSRNIRVITTFHSIDRYHKKWNFFARMFLRLGEWTATHFAHETVVVSRSLQNYCFNEFKRETQYIPNAYNISEKIRMKEKENLSEFGLQKGKYLVMISRLVPHKGAHLLIDAFVKLKENNPNDSNIQNLKLAIVGGSAYTDKYVEKLHKSASICNQIVFTGNQSGDILEDLYAGAKFLIHPSENEGLPITVLQAMSCAQPILVSNIPEHLELVDDPRFVFLVNDIASLQKKIHNMLKMDENTMISIGKNNQKKIKREFSWDIVLPRLLDVYNGGLKKVIFCESELA